MKKIFSIIIAITACITFANAKVYSGTCGAKLTWSLNTEDSTLTISGTGDMTNWGSSTTVPWNSYRSSITSIVIGDSVTSIGSYAFYNCDGFTFIEIPNSVTSIGNRAFQNCDGLTSFEIPGSVTNLGSYIFLGNYGITSITCYAITPPSCNSNTFHKLSSTQLYVPSGSVAAYQEADGWNYLPIQPIAGTEDSEPLSGKCGDEAYWILDINSGVLTITGSGAMYDYIDRWIFNAYGTGSLAPWADYFSRIYSIEVGEGITHLSESLFGREGDNLKHAHLPSTLQTIGGDAFYCTRSLESIICDALTPPQGDNFKGANSNAIIYVPCGTKSAYAKDLYWDYFHNFEDGFYEFIEDTIICGSIYEDTIYWRNHFWNIYPKVEKYDYPEWNMVQYKAVEQNYMLYDSLMTVDGCDSVYHLNLYIYPSSYEVYYDTIYDGDTLQLFGMKVTQSGVYRDTMVNYMGCDSIQEWHIYVQPVSRCTVYAEANNDEYGYINGAGTYPLDSVITLTAVPYNGCYFTHWSDSCTEPQRTIRLTQDTTLIAYFEPNVYTVTVQSADPAKGTVGNVSGDYTDGTVITLTANANDGYSVLNWSDGYRYFCKQSVSRGYTVSQNITLTAYFGVEEPKTGTCGSNLTWYLDCSGTLTISGTGDMTNWTSYTEVPWYNKDTKLGAKGFLPIERVIIEEGVTSVGDFAFRNCRTIVSISLPKTMNSIGIYAFRETGITSLTIPANVSTIQEYAFYNSYLSEVTCLAVTPPNNTNQYKFFNNSRSITFYVPCGTSQAYSSTNNWRYWTYIEGAYAYSVTGATVLQAPTCRNNGTLIIEASDSDVQFFSQWSDGNTDNPRTVQLAQEEAFSVSAVYTQGIKQAVCPGYKFPNPQNGKTYTINQDLVIDDYYFFAKTSHKPTLSEEEYPIMQAGRLYYRDAEQTLREKYQKLNRNAAEIQTIEWAYSVNSDKTADTYIKSDILYSDAYDFAWVKYSALTECGDIIADTMLVYATPASEKPAASQLSTEGKDFWVSSTLVCSPDKETPAPYIAVSAEKECVVTITGGVNNAVHISKPVAAGSWTEFREGQLDPAAWYPINMFSANNVSSLAGQTNYYGLHITATENISVYVILSSIHSMDASNILPITALGSEYYTQDYWAKARNFEEVAGLTTILATEDGTIVDITPQGDTYDGHPSSQKYTILLNQGQTYYLVSQKGGRLSGTHIQARKEKKIAVYCGVPLVNIPTGVSARDCLFEQAFPVEYWGTQFIATRSLEKDGNFIGITAAEDGTEVNVDGEKLCTLDRGQTYLLLLQGPANPYARKPGDSPIDQVITADAIYIETSCPCEIYNYDTGNTFKGMENPTELVDGTGDPSSVWISPIQQKIERITFSTCYTRNTRNHFLNVIAETVSCQQTRLTVMYGANLIDRTSLLNWKSVPGNPAYSYARAKIGDATTQAYSVFRLENRNGVIAHVYGNGEDESYAYSVGSATIKRAVELDGVTYVGEQNEIKSRFCLNEPIHFNAQVGSDAIDRVDWIFGDGEEIHDGATQVEHPYSQAGSYTVKAKLYTHKECPFTLYAPDEMTFHVQVGNADTLRRVYNICEGESFIHEGKIYSGASRDTIVYGCDSIEIFEVKLASCHTDVPDTVTVEPTDHTAGFVWPVMPGAVTYTLTIWADAAQTVSLLTLTFNAAGYLVNIEFGSAFYNPATYYSPMRAPVKKQKSEEITVGTTTLNFTITGLESNHTYYYLLKAHDESNMPVDSKEGYFTTTGEQTPTGIEETESGKLKIEKVLINGQLYIMYNGTMYNVQGQEVTL